MSDTTHSEPEHGDGFHPEPAREEQPRETSGDAQAAPVPAVAQAAAEVRNALEGQQGPLADALKALVAALTAPMPVKAAWLPGYENMPVPKYAHEGDAGMDVHAAFKEAKQTIAAGCQIVVPTGLTVAVPSGYMLSVYPKSGRARNQMLTLTNSPGTIDAPYRGEIQILVVNLGDKPQTINRLEAIAQLVLVPRQLFALEFGGKLDETPRGNGGFGSTGL